MGLAMLIVWNINCDFVKGYHEKLKFSTMNSFICFLVLFVKCCTLASEDVIVTRLFYYPAEGLLFVKVLVWMYGHLLRTS